MRNYENETKNRVEFIKKTISAANAKGIVFGNSGGKDSALVGILCKMACDDTVGLIMPCGSQRNYGTDKTDAQEVAEQYKIAARLVDLSPARAEMAEILGGVTSITDAALANIAPRLRMTALYTVAASENRLVAGTGNRSETHMGYFTKWGDGACDFNPISDLTVTEIYEFLRYLNAPRSIIEKAPSAGLFDGQTDEDEMGVAYDSIDRFLLGVGEISERDRAVIDRFHRASGHKRVMPVTFSTHSF
ncbi:MAG: NAD(+) synthase [Defluviitaleaceae bacterium]|nr:NAD(+) synthase [Defluviitaleaceae bacterium]